jgi:Putative zinc-finger
MRRLTCRTVRDLLPLHCGGDLPQEKAIAVDQHLHACLACFREYREFAAMRGRLGVLAEEPLPQGALDGFTEEVMARLVVGEEGPAAELPSAHGWGRVDQPAVRYAAAAALLVAVGFGLWQADLLPRFGFASPGEPRFTLAAASPGPIENSPSGGAERAETALGPVEESTLAEPASSFIYVDPEHLPPGLLQVPLQLQPKAPFDVQNAEDEGLHPETGRQLRPRGRN